MTIMRPATALTTRISTASPIHSDPASPPVRLWLASRTSKPRVIRYPHRIMVGMDFTRASDAALGLVVAIAATTGTLVDLVHVFDGFTQAFVLGDRPILDRVDAVLADIGHALQSRMVEAAAQGATCVATSLVGAPAVELDRHAEKTGADLLVLGLGGESRSPFGRAWSADAAVQILRTGTWHERPLAAQSPL